jgi:hypothetical protein
VLRVNADAPCSDPVLLLGAPPPGHHHRHDARTVFDPPSTPPAAPTERSRLETADYWLSLGLAIGTEQPEAAVRLLRLIETEEPERAELTTDAKQFVTEALG